MVIVTGALVGPPVSAALILTWSYVSGMPWSRLGFVSPQSWPVTVAGGIAFGVAFKLTMKAVVMPLLGAPPVNAAYHFLAGNPSALPGMLLIVIFSAGFAEELFFRGYIFERMGRLLGESRSALVGIVLISSAVFAVAHYRGQGAPGVEQAAVTGVVFGTLFARRRQIWVLMLAHAAFDVTAVALIYWTLEARVAHLVFTRP
jgi:CAAX protease family protein